MKGNNMHYDFDLVGKIGSMALIRREDADIDYNIFSRLGRELKPGMIWVTSGAAEIGRLDYIKRTGCELTGTDNDVLRTATVKVTIDKNDGRATMDRYAFKVIMKKEDGVWYVDPQSLQSNEKETATETVSTANNTPTQPPLYTGHPDTILYYNPNGGSRYHLDPDCPDVGKKFKPMTSFMFIDLDQSPYNELIPCNRCGAPIPDDD